MGLPLSSSAGFQEILIELPAATAVVVPTAPGIAVGSALTSMVKFCVRISLISSLTETVKLHLPACRAVPEITPVEERDRPFGRPPAVRVQVSAPTPPEAIRVCV